MDCGQWTLCLGSDMKKIRVGLGFDVHRFTKKKKEIVLGGIRIPCGFGIRAVSDGDVLLHAICDGILGAASRGDIGDYFPPKDKSSRGIRSEKIAKFILKKIKGNFKIVNIDTVIIAQKPPLVKHKRRILNSLINIFTTKNINIKIKSKERLNILGGINSIVCFSIVALEKC